MGRGAQKAAPRGPLPYAKQKFSRTLYNGGTSLGHKSESKERGQSWEGLHVTPVRKGAKARWTLAGAPRDPGSFKAVSKGADVGA